MTGVADQGQVVQEGCRVLRIAIVLLLAGNIEHSSVVISARICSITQMEMLKVSTSVPLPMIITEVIACSDCAPLGDAECEQCQQLRLCMREGSEQPSTLAAAPSVAQVGSFL